MFQIIKSLRPFWLLVFAVPILASCQATGMSFAELQTQVEKPKTDYARLFFLRKAMVYGSGDDAQISVNDVPVRYLQSGGFSYIDLASGIASLKVDSAQWGNVGWWDHDLYVEPGKEYYFLVEVNVQRNWHAAIGHHVKGTRPEYGPYLVSQLSQRMAQKILPDLKLSRDQ